MTDEPLRRMAAEADAPVEPTDEFSRRLWSRLSSELAGTGGRSTPAAGEVPDEALFGGGAVDVELEEAEQASPRSPRWYRWALGGAAAAAAIVLAAVVIAHSNTGRTITTHRLDPAASALLTSLQPDNDLYQLRADAEVSDCTPSTGTPTDPSKCGQALAGLETAIQSILSHLAAEPPSSIAAPIGQYRHSLAVELAAVQDAERAVAVPSLAQKVAAVSNGDDAVCQALDRLDAAGNGVVSVGRCPAPRA